MDENINEGGVGSFFPSKTYKIFTPCGNLYITIVSRGKGRFKRLFVHRNSKFHCGTVILDAIAKLATYQGRRNLKQLVKDLRGDKFSLRCEKYYVGCEATSCFDATSQAIQRWMQEKKSKKLSKPLKK